jgi:hypothetical protein
MKSEQVIKIVELYRKLKDGVLKRSDIEEVNSITFRFNDIKIEVKQASEQDDPKLVIVFPNKTVDLQTFVKNREEQELASLKQGAKLLSAVYGDGVAYIMIKDILKKVFGNQK